MSKPAAPAHPQSAAGTASKRVEPARGALRGTLRVPGDKSIAHRAVLFNAAAQGTARLRGLPTGADVLSSIAAVRALGCRIEQADDSLRIEGRALRFDSPSAPIDCGNSGTTMRLLTGLLAGARIEAVLDGDASLRRRPMERVAAPLRSLGARVETSDGRAPVRIHSAALAGTRVQLSIASAQLKSAVLLAGLSASGRTEVVEPSLSRDHTERMLASMGVAVARNGAASAIDGPVVPRAVDVDVCGDASSAAFFTVAGCLVAGSEITIEDVCLNPTRTGFVDVLRRMGADVRCEQTREQAGEPVGRVFAKHSRLHGIDIGPEDVPATIDELPIVAVAAALAHGTTTIRGAGELRVKESDRIATVASMLRVLGGSVRETSDGMEIEGGSLRGGASVATDGDHRIVMAAAIAALACREPVDIEEPGAAAVSFPQFFTLLEGLRA
jgi:3-phosphoshikimate 1-carboxyvinyltransferase